MFSQMKSSIKNKFLYSVVAIFFAIALSGCDAAKTKSSAVPTETRPNTERSVSAQPKVEIKDEIKSETLNFEAQQQDDPTLTKGQTKTKQEGKVGTKETKYRVTFTDGKETAREKISETITVQPINKIILNGTKVATTTQSTGYTNVDGNYVPSPSSSPVGATARCGDGTYSYSQHRSGTCSHHGGVAQWL